MNNTLTAKEWVDKLNRDEDSQWSDYDCNYPMMEKYANYKNRVLEAKILEFRKILVDNAYPEIPVKEDAIDPIVLNAWRDYASTNITIKEYDKHFNIENKQ